MEVVQFLSAHILEIVGGTVMTLNGLLLIAMIIPGEHPDKELQAIVDFLTKFSRK